MRKKILSGLVTCALLTLTACSSQPSGNVSESGNTQPPPKAGFPELTFDYPYTLTQIQSFTANDSAAVIESSGPYYVGVVPYEQPALKELQQAKKDFVSQLNQQTDDLFNSEKHYADALKPLQDKYFGYVGSILETDKKFYQQAKDLATPIVQGKVKAEGLMVQFESINPTTTSEGVRALLQYQKTMLAQDLAKTLTDNTAQTVSGLLALSSLFDSSTDAKLKTAGAELEGQIPGMVDALGSQLKTLQDNSLALGTGLKQLNTAEHMIGLGSVQFMTSQLPNIDQQVSSLKPNATFTKEDIDFFTMYGQTLKQFVADLSTKLNAVDPQELLTPQQTSMLLSQPKNFFIPEAIASIGNGSNENQTVNGPGYFQQAFQALKSGVSKTAEVAGTVGSMTWSAAKSTFKAGQTITGVTLDTVGAVMKTGFDSAYSAANGDSLTEIAQQTKNNFIQVGENYQKGVSGSEILKTANGYFEGAEKLGGEALSGAVEKTVGKGWTSWAAGHVGSLTVNLFTGFGKGISKISNQQSTAGELVEGGLEIGLSFIGGSKAVASGSQIASGSKESLKTLGEKGINFLGKLIYNKDITALKNISADILKNAKITPEEVKLLISNSLDMEFKEGIRDEIIAAGKEINQKLINLIKEGGATVVENATAGAKEEYIKFVETAFEHSLGGYKDALKAVLGDTFKEYIDNLIAAKADDVIKAVTKEYIDGAVIEGVNPAPALKDLAGKWGDGQMVVSDVVADDTFKANATKEGCDLSKIAEQKGKKQAMELSLTPSGENGGTMTVKMADGKPQSMPFTYKDGVITATVSQQGGTMNMTMNVKEENGKYVNTGSLDVNYQDKAGGNLKISASTGASLAIPKAAPKEPAKP